MRQLGKPFLQKEVKDPCRLFTIHTCLEALMLLFFNVKESMADSPANAFHSDEIAETSLTANSG